MPGEPREPRQLQEKIERARQLVAAQRLAEAEAACREILAAMSPDQQADVLNLLGVITLKSGRIAEAEAALRRAVEVNPSSPEAHNNLGEALRRSGRGEEAVQVLLHALTLRPDYPQAGRNLERAYASIDHAALLRRGEELMAEQLYDDAEECLRRALERKPNDVVAAFNLGSTMDMQGRAAEAIAQYERVERLHPRPSTRAAATRLPMIYQSLEDLESWRRRFADEIEKLHAEGFRLDVSELPTPNPFLLAYQGQNDRDLLRRYAELIIPTPAPPVAPPDRGGDARIRVGFISMYLCRHTIGQINKGLIAQLDREKFHVTVFQLGQYDDAVADFIREHADEYIEVPRSLPEAREIVASRGLDVLLYTDLGLESITWSLAFTRLAPVQAVTWGHPSTTGIPTIDYYVSSELLESPSADEHYTERLAGLANLSVYYYRPTLPQSPRGKSGFGFGEDVHVYGCLQSLFKLHPDFDAVLDEILRRDPKGVVILPRGVSRHWEAALVRRMTRTMPQTLSRVRFFDPLPHEQYLSFSAACDVLLAPLHFGAGNTTYEALAFGTPTVTLPTEFLKGRITYGLYKAMGVTDCVASSPQQYVDLAVQLGTDRDFNRAVRERILAHNHVLYENPAGVRDIENFFVDAVNCSRQKR